MESLASRSVALSCAILRLEFPAWMTTGGMDGRIGALSFRSFRLTRMVTGAEAFPLGRSSRATTCRDRDEGSVFGCFPSQAQQPPFIHFAILLLYKPFHFGLDLYKWRDIR